MKPFWKKLTAAALCAAVLLTPALAALKDGEKFPAVNTYPGYGDVKETDWFYGNAKLCYEIGIMTGTDKGFEPNKTLTGPECAAMTARLLEGLTGRAIPAPSTDPDKPWYQHYMDYLGEFINESGSSLYGLIKWYDLAEFEKPATRYDFLVFMALAADGNGDYFSDLNQIAYEDLPDVGGDNQVLQFYNWGILTGKDVYGTFDRNGTLTRAEAAAMVSRMAKPELRRSFTPQDYVLPTAGVSSDTPFFTNGVTAKEYLLQLNSRITLAEYNLGNDFNWHAEYAGKTVLEKVKADALWRCDVTEDMGTQAYKDFDVQVYYSKLIDLMGGPFGAGTEAQPADREADKRYTLTTVTLPDGWTLADDPNVAAGWVGIQRVENKRVAEEAILRSDGLTLALGGYSIYGYEGPSSRGDATRLWVTTNKGLSEDDMARYGFLWNVYDVERGKLLLEQDILDGSPAWSEAEQTYFPVENGPKVLWEDANPYAVDADGSPLPFRQYSELFYLGDGMFNYWGDDWNTDCGLVSLDGTETPTTTFSGYFNGGLWANHGLIAMGHESGMNWVMAYYDYAGNQVSEDFDWAGPIGDDGAGFVCKDGALYRIQF